MSAVADQYEKSNCPLCDNAAVVYVSYEICIQNADRAKCDSVMKKVNSGEIATPEELVEEYKKVIPEKAHPLLEEILSWLEGGE